MDTADTIAAIASAPGRAARGIVRLSGPATPAALNAVLRDAPTAPGAHRVRLRLTSETELPALLLLFKPPASYTAQASGELILPGNPHLLEQVLNLLTDQPGVRLATPGEFSARAYLAGKLTLAQAEGVAQSIAASTDTELSAARAMLDGRTGRHYQAWANECASLLALVEAGIDFTDQEDVIAIAPTDLRARVDALCTQLIDHLGGEPAREPDAPEPLVVLAGAPNAGKSTLFNALLGRTRAAVADQAGTTRDALIEPLELQHALPGAGAVRLADLPGLDENTHGLIDEAMQARARDMIDDADVLLHCDPSGRFTPVGAGETPTISVRTKADLASIIAQPRLSARGPQMINPSEPAILSVCALDGYHLGALRQAIADLSAGARGGGRAGLLPRHRRAIGDAFAELGLAGGLVDPAQRSLSEPELVAGRLRAALDSLGELAGQMPPDEVIGRVFATFCVGK